MMKRNEGYTLAYVVIVLAILAIIAMATMSLALFPQRSQQLTLERMQNKYEAQGLVEQVIGQLEHAATQAELDTIIEHYLDSSTPPSKNPYCVKFVEDGTTKYKLVASAENTVVTAVFTLEQRLDAPPPSQEESTSKTEDTQEDSESSPPPPPAVIGHKAVYLSYKTERIPKAGGNE